ncbi:MAG: hypothetical protein A3K22_06450 [Deltaproteobacteria bacterium RBG_16_42_7]|nr:MAG: hypothetical protein A3K22_06450 [Deltaproteobacteria bacterium RBG_16_42_7]
MTYIDLSVLSQVIFCLPIATFAKPNKWQEANTTRRQNSTHQENIISIQYKVGKKGHQTETNQTG